MTTATIYNPRSYATITASGDYIAQYWTALRNARKITLANLPAISQYADWIRREETAREARRQLWYLYHDAKRDAASLIDESFRRFTPATPNPAELRTAILSDYTRAVLDAISDKEGEEE